MIPPKLDALLPANDRDHSAQLPAPWTRAAIFGLAGLAVGLSVVAALAAEAPKPAAPHLRPPIPDALPPVPPVPRVSPQPVERRPPPPSPCSLTEPRLPRHSLTPRAAIISAAAHLALFAAVLAPLWAAGSPPSHGRRTAARMEVGPQLGPPVFRAFPPPAPVPAPMPKTSLWGGAVDRDKLSDKLSDDLSDNLSIEGAADPAVAVAADAAGAFGFTIIADGASGGGLPDLGIFSEGAVLTLYVPVAAGSRAPAAMWTLECALLAPGTPASDATLLPPFPAHTQPAAWPAAAAAGGMVVLYAALDRGGRLLDIRVVDSPDSALNPAAVAALAGWRFQPASLDGAPAAVRLLLGIPVVLLSPL